MYGEGITTIRYGISEFQNIPEQAKKYFSEHEQFVTRIDFSDPEKVSVEIDYTGVPAVDLPNGLKAGEAIQMKGKSEFQFKYGKISSILDYS